MFLMNEWNNLLIYTIASTILVALFLALFFLFQEGFASLKTLSIISFLFPQKKEKRININYHTNLAQLSGYECGFDVFSDARSPFDVHFYLVSILFIIFDLEVAFLFPWAFGLENMSNYGTFIIIVFFLLLTLGFLYEWMRGALTWTPAGQLLTENSVSFKQNGIGEIIALIFYNSYLYITIALKNYALISWLAIFSWILQGPGYFRSDNINRQLFQTSVAISGLIIIFSKIFAFGIVDTQLDLLILNNGKHFEFINFFQWFDAISLFTNENSQISSFLNLFIWLTTFIIFFSASNFIKSNRTWETTILVWIVLYFLNQIVYTNDFLYLYLTLEGLNLTLYVLIALNNRSESVEASLKYMTLNVLATAVILLGIAILYANTLTTNFDFIQYKFQIISETHLLAQNLWLQVSIWLIVLGLLFKLSAFPLHIWTPDVYEGANTLVTGIMSVPVKIAIFGLFSNLLYYTFASFSSIWQPLILISAIGSVVWGCFGALIQTTIRRFLAYTTINNIGLILSAMCLIAGDFTNIDGLGLSYFYFILYMFVSALIFAFILHLDNNFLNIKFLTDFIVIKNFYNTIKNEKSLLVLLCKILITLFAIILITGLSGIPPFATFYSKFFIILILFKNNFLFVAVTLLITSVITAFYYLNFSKIIIFEKENKNLTQKLNIIRNANWFNNTSKLQFLIIGLTLSLLSFIFIYFSTPVGIKNLFYFTLIIFGPETDFTQIV